MKRVLQHGKTGLYFGFDGRLTADFARAWTFPTLRDASVACMQYHHQAAEFVFRILEPASPWFTAELTFPRPSLTAFRA